MLISYILLEADEEQALLPVGVLVMSASNCNSPRLVLCIFSFCCALYVLAIFAVLYSLSILVVLTFYCISFCLFLLCSQFFVLFVIFVSSRCCLSL